MSLNLTRIAAQVGEMVARLKAGSEERQKRLQHALDVLHSRASDFEYLKRKIASSRTTWLVAGLVDGLDQHYKAPPAPTEFTILATDGSHIDVDRHRSTRCYLINIGTTILHYGVQPSATLDSSPSLYFGDEDLVITPTGVKGREQPIEGTLLGVKRSVDECCQFNQLVALVHTTLNPQKHTFYRLLTTFNSNRCNNQVFISRIEAGETIKDSTGGGTIVKNNTAYVYQIAPC